MSGSLERPSDQGMAVAALGQVFAAILGLAFGGPAAPVLMAALGPFTTRWMERAAAEWTRKTEVVADAALVASGLSDPEELRTLGAFLGGAVASRGDRLDET